MYTRTHTHTQSWGVAKAAAIKSIKTVRSSGFGEASTLIQAIQLAVAAAQASGRRSIINISLGA